MRNRADGCKDAPIAAPLRGEGWFVERADTDTDTEAVDHGERRSGPERRARRRLIVKSKTQEMLRRGREAMAIQTPHPAADAMFDAVERLDTLRQARDVAEAALDRQRELVERMKMCDPFDPDHADWQAVPTVEIAAGLAGLALAESSPYNTMSLDAWVLVVREGIRRAMEG